MAQVSPNVPMGDPLYDVLERLADVGLAPGYMRGTRPVSLTYAVSLVRRAQELAARRGNPAPELLVTAGDLVERLRPVRVGRVDAGGELEVAVGGSREVVTPAIYSLGNRAGHLERVADAGVAPTDGVGWGVSARAAGWGYVAASATTSLLVERAGARAALRRGYVKTGIGALELEAGRDDLVWGHGCTGAMTLSGNARALDHVGVRTARPFRFPGVFRHVGLVQASLFLARLDQELPHPNPYLVGKRLNVLVRPWLELGFSHLFGFGGDGAPAFPADLFAEEFLFGYRRNVYGVNRVNNAFAWDVRARIKDWLEVYGEHYLDDCCATMARRDSAFLIGLRRPRLTSWRDDLTLEVVTTTLIAYIHARTAELSQQGRVLGHPLGNSGLATYLRWRYVGDQGALLRVTLGFEDRRPPDVEEVPGAVSEWRLGGFLEGRVPLRRGRRRRVDLRAQLAVQRIFSTGHRLGDASLAGLARLSAEVTF